MCTIINFAIMLTGAVIGWNILTGIVFPIITFIITAFVNIVIYVITLVVQMLFLGAGIAITLALIRKAMKAEECINNNSGDFNQDQNYYIHEENTEHNFNRKGYEYYNSHSHGRTHANGRKQSKISEQIRRAENFFNMDQR